MDYDACRELHRELVYRLKRELTFYRSLYVLILRQREAALRGAEADMAVSYGELDTIMGGLKESEFVVSAMREKEPKLFEQAAAMNPVPELVGQAHDILRATHNAMEEGAMAARQHYRKIQAELARLGKEHETLKTYPAAPKPGHSLDETR
jgi:hypothetical protein